MGKKKYLVGGAIAAAAGYLYYRYSDDIEFEYEAEFETEVEVVEQDGVDEHEETGHHEEMDDEEEHSVEDDEHDAEPHHEDESGGAEDYDALMETSLDAIDGNAVEGTNVYAVEPFTDRAEGTPLSKYDELDTEPDIVISSFAGRNLMFVVADEERLDDIEAVIEVIEGISSKAGFSVLLVVPDTAYARDAAEQIKSRLDDVSLYVKTPDNIAEAL